MFVNTYYHIKILMEVIKNNIITLYSLKSREIKTKIVTDSQWNWNQRETGFPAREPALAKDMQQIIKRSLYAALGNADLEHKIQGTWRFYMPFECIANFKHPRPFYSRSSFIFISFFVMPWCNRTFTSQDADGTGKY